MIQAIILGVIQGLTEFLPISSSGHLLIAEKLMGTSFDLSFDVFLHLGTAIAIVIFFRKDLFLLIKDIPHWIRMVKQRQWKIWRQHLITQILLGSIPAGIIGLLVADGIESNLRLPVVVAINTIVFGILLGISDRITHHYEKRKGVPAGSGMQEGSTLTDAFFIGIAQILAFMPGVSRSGITMTTARFRGISRFHAARLSFLIGLPLVLAGGFKGFLDIVQDGMNLPITDALAAGLASFLVGLLALRLLMVVIKAQSFLPFMYYRIGLGVVIFALIATGVL